MKISFLSLNVIYNKEKLSIYHRAYAISWNFILSIKNILKKKCYVYNIFTINHRYLVVISSNLNLPLNLCICPTNNNSQPITTCHLKFIVRLSWKYCGYSIFLYIHSCNICFLDLDWINKCLKCQSDMRIGYWSFK